MARYLKSRVNGTIVAWSKSVSRNTSVFECDKAGNPVGPDIVAETPVVEAAEPPMAAAAPEAAIDVPPKPKADAAAAFGGGSDDAGN